MNVHCPAPGCGTRSSSVPTVGLFPQWPSPILARRRKTLGDNHPDTLIRANNLANRLADLGDHEQARQVGE